jgi:hypothetical protein
MACAQRNPRLHEKAPGYLLNVWDNGVHLGGKQFKKGFHKIFDDESPKLGSALGYSLLGTLCIGVGAVAGIGGGLMKLFSPKREY